MPRSQDRSDRNPRLCNVVGVTNTDQTSQARVEELARAAYGKLLAMLAARTGDIIDAEDALADAFEQALTTWPKDGPPANPEAWLLTVARNRRIDKARRDTRLVITDEVPEMHVLPDIEQDTQLDARLKLMFVCAHPAIDASLHTPLMLQTVLGLEADDIARAFLRSPSAMAQRLVRAKRKIKTAKIPFRIPDSDEYAPRLNAVMEAVYGAYSSDWLDGSGDLSHEALFMAHLLVELAPKNPEALGLLSLLTFLEARRDARDDQGVLVPLPDQDTRKWDRDLTNRAEDVLQQAADHRQIGRFQIEAAIQNVHARRRVSGETDWRALSKLYAGLVKIYPTLGGHVAWAATVLRDAGPAAALALLDRIQDPAIDRFQPALAARAQCYKELGDVGAATQYLTKAIALTTHAPSRRWLERELETLKAAVS